MKNLLTFSRTLATMALLGMAAYATAQSLGNVRTEAWVGHSILLSDLPLDPMPTVAGAPRALPLATVQALAEATQSAGAPTALVQQLEGDLAQLRQADGQTRSELAALSQRLDSLQPAFLSFQTARILILLLLAAAAAAAFLWWRTSRSANGPGQWYAPPGDSRDDSALEPQPELAPVAERSAPLDFDFDIATAPPVPAPHESTVAFRAPGVFGSPPEQASLLGAGAVDFDPSESAPLARPPERRPEGTLLRVETLAATFEEVEFLASLGLWSDAMDLLKTYLEDSGTPAPLAFFELMQLCEQTDDAGAMASVRRRYGQVFGVEPPKLDRINAPLGLEDRELAVAITRAWGRPVALELIEHSLFDVPDPDRGFTLQAGRDLLFLHDLAMTLLRESAPTVASDVHVLAPWAKVDGPHGAAQDAAEAAGGLRFGLDLDLDLGTEQVPAWASQPEPQFEPVQPEELDSLRAELQASADRNAADRARAIDEQEDPFSAAVANESMRRPMKR